MADEMAGLVKKSNGPKLLKKLAQADFSLTESVQVSHTAYPPVGTTREDVLNPLFWSHVAKSMRSSDTINVLPKDGAWYAEFLVIYADQIQAKVKELNYWVLEEIKESDLETELYQVKWISPPVKWGVVRKADKHVVKDSFPMKIEAVKWMQEHLKAMGG